MGCKWTKLQNAARVAPINNDPPNQVLPLVDDTVTAQPNAGSFPVTVKQSTTNGAEHSNQNNKHILVDGSINQSSTVPLENLKPSSTDEHLSQRINSTTSNKCPGSAENEQEKDDETISIASESIVEENIDHPVVSGNNDIT